MDLRTSELGMARDDEKDFRLFFKEGLILHIFPAVERGAGKIGFEPKKNPGKTGMFFQKSRLKTAGRQYCRVTENT